MDRSKPKGKVQVFPILATLLVSAYFHGFYIGYYLCFILFGVLEFSWKLAETTAFVQMLRKKLPAPVITAISTVLLSVLFKFVFIPFFLLCNYRPSGVERLWPVLFHWDGAYWAGSMLFGLSGGYLSSLALMYCPR